MVEGKKPRDRDPIRLVGLLYDATTEPDSWPMALDEIGDALGGAVLVSSVHRSSGMAFGATHRLDPDADKVLRAHYSSPETNPLMAAMPRLPVLAPVAREQVIEDANYLGSGLFNDVFRSQGLVHVALSCLGREGGLMVPCGVLRRKNQEFDTECVALFEQILPHLRRALLLTVRFSDLQEARACAEAAADTGVDGLLVTDHVSRIIYSNTVAEQILARADGLSSRAGRLTAGLPLETRVLHQLIASAALRSGYVGGNLRVSRPGASVPWALVIMPTPPGLAYGAGAGAATALVRVIDVGSRPVAPEARLRELFGLSRAEASVAMALMKGERVEDIAERQQVRVTTVRTQIRSIYAKTHTSRQTDLLGLLFQVAGPPNRL